MRRLLQGAGRVVLGLCCGCVQAAARAACVLGASCVAEVAYMHACVVLALYITMAGAGLSGVRAITLGLKWLSAYSSLAMSSHGLQVYRMGSSCQDGAASRAACASC